MSISIVLLVLASIALLLDSASAFKLNSTYCVQYDWPDLGTIQYQLQADSSLAKGAYVGNVIQVSTKKYGMLYCVTRPTDQGDQVFMTCFDDGSGKFYEAGSAMLVINKKGIESLSEVWVDMTSGKPMTSSDKITACKFTGVKQ